MASTVRALRRRRKMFAVATGAALTGATAFYSLAVAEPVSQDVPASCTIGTSKVDVTIPLTVDDLMDPVAAGGAESVVIKTDLPELPIEVTVQKLTVTIPIPGEIASVDAVSFSGGNMTGSYAVSGSDLVLTFTGPQSSSQLELPSVTADQTVKADIAPTTISWRTFSRAVADTNYGQAACTPNDPSQVINTTKVNAAEAEPTLVADFHPVGDGESEFRVRDGVRPGQVGTLVDERVDPVDVTATVLDLAVRGHLRIEELPRSAAYAEGEWTFTRRDSDDDLRAALAAFGGNGVLKTRRMGYDGKGQRVFRGDGDDPAGAFAAMGGVPLILESFVAFEREISVIAARGIEGLRLASNGITERLGIIGEAVPTVGCGARLQNAGLRVHPSGIGKKRRNSSTALV